MKKNFTTHKIITYSVHLVCGLAAIYVFIKWGQGTVTDAPSMLNPIAMIEVINLTQYSGKSAFEHSKGIFSNPIVGAAISGLSSGDAASAVSQVINTVQANEQMNDMKQSSDNQQGSPSETEYDGSLDESTSPSVSESQLTNQTNSDTPSQNQ